MKKLSTNRGRLALAAVAISGFASSLLGQVVDTTWLGGAGSWEDASKWSNGVPVNSPSTEFRAFVPSGSIVSNNTFTIDALTLGSGASISLQSPSGTYAILNSTQIDGSLTTGAFQTLALGPTCALHGTGTLSIDPQSRSGTFTTSSGPLTIDSGMTVRAAGYLGNKNFAIENSGHIVGANAIVAASPISNLGTIDGPVYFDGSFTRAGLGQLPGTGYTILGTLVNDGETFHVDSTTPSWHLAGTINGGSIETGNGKSLFVPYAYSGPTGLVLSAHLNNVEVNGSITVDSTGYLAIDDGNLHGNADIHLLTQVGDGQTQLVSGVSTLTISSGMFIHGNGTSTTPTFGNGTRIGGSSGLAITNHGRIRSEPVGFSGPSELDLMGSVFNDGSLQIQDQTFIYCSSNMTFGENGELDVAMSATSGAGLLRLAGALDLTVASDVLALTTSPGILPGVFYRIVTTSKGITGEFDSVTPGFVVQYRNGKEIWAEVVPEPTMAAMFAITPAILLRRRRA